jgi:hypothetical protein
MVYNQLISKKQDILNDLIGIVVVSYFSFGLFYQLHTTYIDSAILIVLCYLLILHIITKKPNFDRTIFLIYSSCFALLCLCMTILLLEVQETQLLIQRFLRVFSFLVLLLFYSVFIDKDLYKTILARILNISYYVGLVIIGDSLLFMLIGNSFWPPELVVKLRFAGPFGDANHLSMFFGVIFIIDMHLFPKNKFRKLIYLINITLGMSLSVLSILIISAIIGLLIKVKHPALIISIIYATYFIGSRLIYSNFPYITDVVNGVAESIGINSEIISIKLWSLYLRLNYQDFAISSFLNQPFGLGPKYVIKSLGHDSHNSFITTITELGIQGLLIFILPWMVKVKKQIFHLKWLILFITLVSLFVDVFFTPVFWLGIFYLYYCYNHENVKGIL